MFNTDKFIKYGLYFIALLPLLFTPFTFFPWHFGKTMVFQIIVEILVVLWVLQKRHCERSACLPVRQEAIQSSFLKCTRLRRFARNIVDSFKSLNLLDWSILIFLTIITITAFTGADFSNSFLGKQARANGVFTWLHFGAFYFLLVSFFRSHNVIATRQLAEKQSRSLFFIAVLVAALVSFTALWPEVLPATWQSMAGGGIIGNRAFLAGYLLLAAGLAVYLFLIYKNNWRWFFLAAAALFLLVIWQTSNRGALIGLFFGVFVGLIVAFFILQSKKQKIVIAASFLTLMMLFLILFFVSQRSFVQSRAPNLANLFNPVRFTSGTSATRLLVWQMAWNGFKERPLLGWGTGNFNLVFDKYFNPKLSQYGFSETVWDKPHNWLLEIANSAGIVGLISYTAILFFAFYYLLRQKKDKMTLTSGVRVIIVSTLAAYLIFDLFLFETTNSLILWFILLAFISASCHQETASRLVAPTRSVARRIFKFGLLLLFVFLFYRVFYLPLRSSYHMRQAELSGDLADWSAHAGKVLTISNFFVAENAVFLAEQFTQFNKANAVSNNKEIENIALNIASVLEKSAVKNPQNLSFPAWAGQVYLVLGEQMNSEYYKTAEKNLLSARAISPAKQEILFLLGRLYLLEKKFDKAIEMQKQAVELAPEIGLSHWFLGLTHVAAGQLEDGLYEIEKSQELEYALNQNQKTYLLDLYGLAKNYSKLIEEYEKLVNSEPENVNWYIKLATAYALNGDKQKALEMAKQIISLAPQIKPEADKFIKDYKLDKN